MATIAQSQDVTIAARLDRLPPSRFVRGLITRICLGGFFESYDLFLTTYIALGLIKAGIFRPTTAGLFDLHGFASFVGAGFAGMFLGTIVVSWMSDHFGRRVIFVYFLVWYSIATFIMAFAGTPATLDLWRFLAGIGIGVELVNVDAYVSELVPKNERGRAIAYTQFVYGVAVPIVALLGTLFIPRTIFGLDGWRWVVIIGSLGAIVVWWIRLGLPESPRWLETHGRSAEADRIMEKIEAHVTEETGRPLPPPVVLPAERTGAHGSWFEMWDPAYRSRTIMLAIFNFFQTFGYYGFAAWVPILLASEGVTFVHSLEYTFIIAIAQPVAPLIAMRVADLVERKWQLVASAVAIAVFGIIFSQMRAPAAIIALGVCVTISINWLSWTFHAYQTELYPTRIRAQACGFVYSWSRISVIFVGFWVAALLRHYGTIGVFTLIAAAMLVVVVVIGAMGPRTNLLRLEEVSS